jgi:glycosyltransferase involved in cell wall biosynthesis
LNSARLGASEDIRLINAEQDPQKLVAREIGADAEPMMKVTVITVCYNSSATIRDTLNSIAAQDYRDIEHIVIDGASKDNTAELVRQHAGHTVKLVSEPDKGIYDAMNKGIALATGDIVGFLNADDMYETNDAVTKIAAAFRANDIDGVYGDLVLVDQLNTARVVRYWRSCNHVSGMCQQGWMPPHPTLYVRRSFLTSGFNTDFKIQADFELILRLFEIARIRSLYLPTTLVRMRLGGTTTGSFRNIIKGNVEAARACELHGFGGGATFMFKKMIRKVPQFFVRPAPLAK